MQENLIELLKQDGIELQKIEMADWEELSENEGQRKMIYRIMDLDRLIFLIELEDIGSEDLEHYVNWLVEWIHKHSSEGEEFVESYQQIPMRMVLWDMYVIFSSCIAEENKGLQDEEVYFIQRNSRFMKRYVIQGISSDEIAKKINFIVKPEKTIDNYINKLNFENDEGKYCKVISHTDEGNKFGFGFEGETYQEIIAVLEKINEETFGENTNEDTGN